MIERFIRAKCLYSKVAQFANGRLYSFELVKQFNSYDVYITDGALFAFRFMGDSTRGLLIESEHDGVIAVFEIALECTK